MMFLLGRRFDASSVGDAKGLRKVCASRMKKWGRKDLSMKFSQVVKAFSERCRRCGEDGRGPE
jgi:hypothetical protein